MTFFQKPTHPAQEMSCMAKCYTYNFEHFELLFVFSIIFAFPLSPQPFLMCEAKFAAFQNIRKVKSKLSECNYVELSESKL